MSAPQQWAVRLARYPEGLPQVADFSLERAAIPMPATGEVLLRSLYLSLDPYLRPLLAGRYVVPRPPLGALVPGSTLSQVVQSDDAAWPVGTLVVADTCWSEYATATPERLRKVAAGDLPASTALGVLGVPGLTAWAGMRSIGQPQAGETVLVSTAAGAVGSLAGQLAKQAGCRVIGIAGSEEKCRIAREDFGFDACISYRSGNLKTELREVCPDGIDVYFDNVGVQVLEAALSCLRLRARIVLCGLSGQYNDSTPPPGPHLGPVIGARARMEGLVVYDHFHRFAEFREEVGGMIRAGRVRYREDVREGLEQAAAGFVALMHGENLGKSLIKLADPLVTEEST